MTVGYRVAIVGAGWSGLACALRLVDEGCEVTLFDAAPQPGGRARRVDLALGDRTYALDNGQHLLIGAYRDTLALMRRVGLSPDALMQRMSFAMRYPDGWQLSAAAGFPAPLHLALGLLRSTGIPWRARLALALRIQTWRLLGWKTDPQRSAAVLLEGLPPVLIERLLRPLCLAALNVDLETASAQFFLNVLRDSLGADAQASELLIPKQHLSAVFPDAAAAYLQKSGAALRCSTLIDQLQHDHSTGSWRLAGRSSTASVDAVVIALPPWRAADLLASTNESQLSEVIRQLRSIDAAPIATVYLRYADSVHLPFPLYALRDNAAVHQYGQWLFDRGAFEPACAGVMSVVISGPGPHAQLDQQDLAQHVVRQLGQTLQLPDPLALRVVTEKRATIVPAPGLQRPAAALPLRGLYLAGDAADSPYPSTIEGSVRAGLDAADALIAQR